MDRDRSLTYAEAVTVAERVAGGLAALGVGPGDRVGIFAHNGLDYLTAMFGTWRLGAICALVNVQYAQSLDYYVGDARPRVLVYTGDHFRTIDEHRPNLPSVEHYVCFDGAQDGAIGWDDMLDAAPAPPRDRTEDGDVAHLSYTSGSSGPPKGACLAHEPTMRATRCIAERLRLRAARRQPRPHRAVQLVPAGGQPAAGPPRRRHHLRDEPVDGRRRLGGRRAARRDGRGGQPNRAP